MKDFGGPFFCVRCECKAVRTFSQEPYGDGMLFQTMACAACGWAKIVRDDWYPERNGQEGSMIGKVIVPKCPRIDSRDGGAS